MVGRVGKDAFGDQMLQSLTNDGIDVSQVGRDPQAPTGVALITVDERAENTIVVASGANMCITPEDVSAAKKCFAGAAAVVMQFETPLPAIQRACHLAHQHGSAYYHCNPAPARMLEPEFLADIDDLIP